MTIEADLEKIRLEDGDILKVEVSASVTAEQLGHFKDRLKGMVRGMGVDAQVLVVGLPVKVEIVKADDALSIFTRLAVLEREVFGDGYR